MYYRIAIKVQPSQSWRWVSTALSSMTNVKQWLLHYHAYPSTRLRVFSSTSWEGLCEQLLNDSDVVPSVSTPAAKFLSAQSDSPAAPMRETNNAVQSVGGVLATSDESLLDRRRDELERGAGGDHDLPYRFTLPASMLQLHAWVRLLARVEHGDLRVEKMPVGAGIGSSAECSPEVSDCTRSNTDA
jgi:hypothetical protein